MTQKLTKKITYIEEYGYDKKRKWWWFTFDYPIGELSFNKEKISVGTFVIPDTFIKWFNRASDNNRCKFIGHYHWYVTLLLEAFKILKKEKIIYDKRKKNK